MPPSAGAAGIAAVPPSAAAAGAPLRIVHVLRDVRNLGNGIVNAAVDLACAQAGQGHDVWVASSGGEFGDLLSEQGVRQLPLDCGHSIGALARAPVALRLLLADVQPHIVHAHMLTELLVARAARVRCSRFGLVATVHNEWKRSAHHMRIADRVIAVSAANATSLVRRGVAEHKVRTVLNGCVGSPRSSGSSALLTLSAPSVVCVAGLYERKGIRELLDATRLLHDRGVWVHTYLVGDGPDRLSLEEHARGMGLDGHVHFEGFRADPRPYLAACTVFALCSRQEPFALAVLEARQSGCPIVATDTGGIPEVLAHGTAGVLVPVGRPDRVADEIERLISDDKLRVRLGRASCRGLRPFTVDRVAAETVAVYRELVAENGGRR